MQDRFKYVRLSSPHILLFLIHNFSWTQIFIALCLKRDMYLNTLEIKFFDSFFFMHKTYDHVYLGWFNSIPFINILIFVFFFICVKFIPRFMDTLSFNKQIRYGIEIFEINKWNQSGWFVVWEVTYCFHHHLGRVFVSFRWS